MNRTDRAAARGIVAYVKRNPGCSRTAVISAGFPYRALQKVISNGLIRADHPDITGPYHLYLGEAGAVGEAAEDSS